jgi:hypothetical protein
MELLAWIDQSAFATWVRESPSLWAYPGIITVHTVGLALLVGTNAVIDLSILSSVPRTALAPMTKLFPIMWIGFWLNALSGVALLVADASAMVTNPVMWIKFGFIILAVLNMRLITHGVFRGLSGEAPVSFRGKALAASSLILWMGAIVAGRLTAYIGQ